jgi:hypothetical protein
MHLCLRAGRYENHPRSGIKVPTRHKSTRCAIMRGDAVALQRRRVPHRSSRHSLHRLRDSRDLLLSSSRSPAQCGRSEAKASSSFLNSATQSRRWHARRRIFPTAQPEASQRRTADSPEPRTRRSRDQTCGLQPRRSDYWGTTGRGRRGGETGRGRTGRGTDGWSGPQN